MFSTQVTGLDAFISATDALAQQSIPKEAGRHAATAAAERLRHDLVAELSRTQGRKRPIHGNPFTIESQDIRDGVSVSVVERDRSADSPLSRARKSSSTGGIADQVGRHRKRTDAPAGPRGGIAGTMAGDQMDFDALTARFETDFYATLADVWEAMIESAF